MSDPYIAGPTGDKFRADCRVELEMTTADGIQLNIKSKVDVMYGSALQEQARQVLEALGIINAKVAIYDAGALPFTLAARIETAVKRAQPRNQRQSLPNFSPKCQTATNKDRLRRTRLYIPGSQPNLMINAGLYHADAVIFDLEDSVAPNEKDAARILVRNSLRCIDLGPSERLVRINPLPVGLEDIKAIAAQNVHVLMIPKCESPDQITKVDNIVSQVLAEQKIEHEIFYLPIIESALGVLNAYQIATASDKVVALSIGLEDYTADIGVPRTKKGDESLWARCSVINAAKAARLQALDTVYSDVDDLEGLLEDTRQAKALGFEGKGCIHPRQIKVIHQGFAPSEDEIKRACQIVAAYEKAQNQGLGVLALGSKMIDLPVLKRAQKTVDLAILLGNLEQNWRENQDQ
ncbi:MAG: HpcH/HpaI aldolase/citrate lyase family protein [Planctomycetes bacterium]|nr:HpcH/HpaI aldolase/citrate lyase family protein [Planctomycetota bacterium]